MWQNSSTRRQRHIVAAAILCITGLMWCLIHVGPEWAAVTTVINPLFLPPQPYNPTSSSEAVVTLYTPPEGVIDAENSYWNVLLTLIYQVKFDPHTRTDKDMVIMITPNTEQWRRDALQKLGVVLFEAPKPESPMKALRNNWLTVLAKIHVFRLPYKRVVYMDTDMLLLQSIDVIFESPAINSIISCDLDEAGEIIGPQMAGGPEKDCCAQASLPFSESFQQYKRNGINAGMMVVCPDPTTYKGVKELAARGPRGDPSGMDQVLFDDYFALDGPNPRGVLPLEFALLHAENTAWEAYERGQEKNVVMLHGKWWQPLKDESKLRITRAWWYSRGKMEGMFDWLPWEMVDESQA